MIVANLNNNKSRKFYCAIIVLVGALSLYAWHLTMNRGQQQWLIKWLAMNDTNSPGKTKLSLRAKLLQKLNSFHHGTNTNLSKMRNATNLSDFLEKTQSEPIPRKVLIISRGRSGSSFLGDLFNQNKDTFYLFEPLFWAIIDLEGYATKTFEVLNDLYNCKFTDKIYLDFLLKSKSFRKKSKKLETFPAQCPRISKSSQRCLTNILKSSCLGASSLIAKVLTHRLPQGGLWGIRKILDANKNLRIVHLLRDPRRVISSMKRAGWFRGNDFVTKVKHVCFPIWENIKHVLNESVYYKDRYKVLVFSDMMLDPSSTVVDLYDFLKMGPVPDYVFSWIKQNTMVSVQVSKSKSTYKTSRNSTEVLNRKVGFTEFNEMIIDKYCGNVTRFIDKIRKNSI